MPIMSIGQVAEILTMFILGATLVKLGWKTTMVIGILGHAARFAVYAFFPQSASLIITIQVLHGICYAFFFATVYIFVDAYFPKDVRSSAQGLFNVMVLGLGALVANSICPFLLQNKFTHDGVVDFKGLFLVPCFVALAAAVVLAIAFHRRKTSRPLRAKVAVPTLNPRHTTRAVPSICATGCPWRPYPPVAGFDFRLRSTLAKGARVLTRGSGVLARDVRSWARKHG